VYGLDAQLSSLEIKKGKIMWNRQTAASVLMISPQMRCLAWLAGMNSVKAVGTAISTAKYEMGKYPIITIYMIGE